MTQAILDKTGETWVLTRDTRHGVAGWRACRYTGDGDEPSWDEHYMFFTSLDVAATAFERDDLDPGRAAF